MIVIGNPAVLMTDPHWLALLMSCRNAGSVTGQPMPDLSDAAAAAASGTHAGAQGTSSTSHTASNSSSSYHQSGVYTAPGGAASSSSGRDGISSSMQQQIVQLEKLMASISLSKAVEEVAAQTLLLEGPLGFSGLVDEVGGGMVRHD
jgi:hypothetical protein